MSFSIIEKTKLILSLGKKLPLIDLFRNQSFIKYLIIKVIKFAYLQVCLSNLTLKFFEDIVCI